MIERRTPVASVRMSIYNKEFQVFSKSDDPEQAYKILTEKLKAVLDKLAKKSQRCKHCNFECNAWENTNVVDIEVHLGDEWYCKCCKEVNTNGT